MFIAGYKFENVEYKKKRLQPQVTSETSTVVCLRVSLSHQPGPMDLWLATSHFLFL